MRNAQALVHIKIKQAQQLHAIARSVSGSVKYTRTNMTNLIKDINDSLKAKDPVAEAIKLVSENMGDPTHLDDEQVDSLADYMKEMIDDAKVRGSLMDVQDAAGMALEDVAGFEAAPKRVMQATVARLMRAYIKKFGE
jgi:archaellum component FlaC